MTKPKRPYIPLRIREEVIEAQAVGTGVDFTFAAKSHKSAAKRIKWKLEELFGTGTKVELHHRPALMNRNHNSVGYWPAANDPAYLVYLPADEHDIETRVRGQHGDYSDLAKARKRKRKERKAEQRKFKWPKRKFRR